MLCYIKVLNTHIGDGWEVLERMEFLCSLIFKNREFIM